MKLLLVLVGEFIYPYMGTLRYMVYSSVHGLVGIMQNTVLSTFAFNTPSEVYNVLCTFWYYLVHGLEFLCTSMLYLLIGT